MVAVISKTVRESKLGTIADGLLHRISRCVRIVLAIAVIRSQPSMGGKGVAITQLDDFLRSDPSSSRAPHDQKYEAGLAFVNGEYRNLEAATIPLWDCGFLHSDVTYEVATVSRGRFFRLQDHFERFSHSCESFRLRKPYGNDQMLDIFTTLLRDTGLKNASLFWCVTRGLPKPGTNAVRDRNNPDAFESRFYAATYPWGSIATQEQRNRGFDILISQRYIRIPPKAVDPRAKNFHWMDMKLALFEAHDQGKDWVVLTDSEGYLTECAGANIFVVKDGALYTPASGCLQGITRKTALELAAMVGVPVHLENVHAKQLADADDAFITTSAGGIIPVNSVDGVLLGGVQGPGPVATLFHNLYWEKVWQGWKCAAVDYQPSEMRRAE